MKLLFITQKVDKDDDVLGVYHRWIEGLSKKFDKISVICLYQGRTELPANVSVYSLGKERHVSRWTYVPRFFNLIWGLRNQYDAVFVHMNPEYVILGGLLWRVMGKRVTLWYAHYLANWRIAIASWLSHKIVTSVKMAYPLESSKLEVLQQGIDTEKFKPSHSGTKDEKFRVLFLGRIAPVKGLDTLVKAVALARESNKRIFLSVVGSPTVGREAELKYYEKIKGLIAELKIEGAVEFLPAVSNYKTPAIYNQHDIFINLTASGSFDKSTLEAMACGLPILVSNLVFLDILPVNMQEKLMFPEKDYRILAEKIINLEKSDVNERGDVGRLLRGIIVAKHGLSDLMDKLASAIQSA